MADIISLGDSAREKIKGNILLIDDDESILRLLSKILIAEGHEVTTVMSGSEAIELFRDKQFNLVITDMYMPELDGLDVIRNLKDINLNTPIIVLTAAGSVGNVVQSLKLGAFNYMTKPFNVADVCEIVQKALGAYASINSKKNFFSFLKMSRNVFRITSEISHLEEISYFLNHWLGFSAFKSTWQIQLAFTEAFTNAVVHGNKNDPHKFVDVEITFSGEEVVIIIKDKGKGFKVPDLKSYALSDDIYASSGRGIFLMNSYMDSLSFNETGNQITMTKKRD
jgi:CheY-like chemotaxis protein/anti-sigma regulatory factor (Ser/Thr protein kinase)